MTNCMDDLLWTRRLEELCADGDSRGAGGGRAARDPVPLDLSRLATAYGVAPADFPQDFVSYVAGQGLGGLSGESLSIRIAPLSWLRTEGLDVFEATGGWLPFGRDPSGSVFFLDTCGRLGPPKPWAVGVQLGRAPLSRDLTGVMLAGRSVTELIGSVLAGYSCAGSPDFPAVLPERFSAIPGRARQKALDVLARLPLSLSELRDHPARDELDGQVSVGPMGEWLLYPPCHPDQLRRLHDELEPQLAQPLERLYGVAASATLRLDAAHWVHLDHVDALVNPRAMRDAFGWTAPGLVRVGSVRSGREHIALFVAMRGGGAGEIVGCHTAQLWAPTPAVHPLGTDFEQATRRMLEAWAADEEALPTSR